MLSDAPPPAASSRPQRGAVWHDVGSHDVLEPGRMTRIRVGSRAILLIRAMDGAYFAVRPVCPHQGVDLSRGRLTGHMVAGAVGEYRMIDDALVLRCPRHGYEFDVRDGCSWFDPEKVRIRTYQVRVDAARVLVQV